MSSKESVAREYSEKSETLWQRKLKDCNKMSSGTFSHLWNHLERVRRKLHGEATVKRAASTKKRYTENTNDSRKKTATLTTYFIQPPINTAIFKKMIIQC